jgi:hypothetical protein
VWIAVWWPLTILVVGLGAYAFGRTQGQYLTCERWHLYVEGRRVVVRRMVRRPGEFDPARYATAMTIDFDPESDDDRAAALVRAEGVRDGLNHLCAAAEATA